LHWIETYSLCEWTMIYWAFDRTKYRAAITDFERLYRFGLSKDSILSGRYSPKALLEIGAQAWREAERPAREWRSKSPQLWGLCHYVAQRDREDSLDPSL